MLEAARWRTRTLAEGRARLSTLDVKATDDKPALFFSSLFPGLAPSIHAHARVSIETEDVATGSIPIALPDPAPKIARAYFVNESTGAVLTGAGGTPLSVPLFYNTTAGGLDYWSSVDTSVTPSVYHTVPITTMPAAEVGIRIALSGTTTTDVCGQPLVSCFDSGSGNTAPVGTTPLYGIDNFRVYDPSVTPGASATSALVIYGAKLTTASCTNPYFVSADCSVTLNAWIKLPATINTATRPKFEIDARLDGAQNPPQQHQMTPDATGAACPSLPAPPAGATCWVATIPVSAAASPWHTINVAWKDTDNGDHLGGTACGGGGNVCDDYKHRRRDRPARIRGQLRWVRPDPVGRPARLQRPPGGARGKHRLPQLRRGFLFGTGWCANWPHAVLLDRQSR